MNLDTLVEAYIRSNAQLAFIISEYTMYTNIADPRRGGTSVATEDPTTGRLGEPSLISPDTGSSMSDEARKKSRKRRARLLRALRKRERDPGNRPAVRRVRGSGPGVVHFISDK